MKTCARLHIVFLLLTLSASALAMAQDQVVAPPESVSSARKAALKACEDLDAHVQPQCATVVEKTIGLFERYWDEKRSDLTRVDAMLTDAIKRSSVHASSCSKGDKDGCLQATVNETRLSQLQATKTRLITSAEENRSIVVRRLSKIAPLLREKRQPFVAVVKVRATGRIRVVPTAYLVAYYDDYMVGSILDDLSRLAQILRVTESTALVSCPQGKWKALPAKQWTETVRRYGLQDSYKALTTGKSPTELTDLCDSPGNDDGGDSDSGRMNGFTGLSGFDSMGPLACMAKEMSTAAEMVNSLTKKIAAMQQTCGSDVKSTLIEGDQTSSSATPTVVSTETTTSTDSSGNVTTTTTTKYSDGSTKKHVQTKDSSGNVVHDGTQTKTDTDGDGVLDKTVTNVATPDPDDAGTTNHLVFVQDKNGVDVHSYSTKAGDWRIYDQQQIFNASFKTCVDETCASCQNAIDTADLMAMRCGSLSSGICKGLGNATSCCGEADAGFMDPTIATPNQDDMYSCRSNDKTAATQSACKAICSLATDLNCEDRCNASLPGNIPFDAADAICLRAKSEDCYSSDVVFAFPSGTVLPPGPNPPVVFTDHLLIK